MIHLGDVLEDSTIYVPFNTRNAEGAPAAPSSALAASDFSFRKNGAAATITASVTLNNPATGKYELVIDLSGDTDFTADSAWEIYHSGSQTVDGVAIANTVIASWTIEKHVLKILKDATFGLSALETLVDDLETRLGTPSDLGSGASIAKNLVDIEAQTDDIGAAGAGLTAIPWNASWDAEVQSEVADALAVYDPPTKAELDSAVAPLALEATLGTPADTDLATDIANVKAKTDNLPSDPADASVVAGLIAAAEAKIDTVDTVVDAIKAKTDSLTFTVAGQVDSNAKAVNDVALTGDGDATPWGPA